MIRTIAALLSAACGAGLAHAQTAQPVPQDEAARSILDDVLTEAPPAGGETGPEAPRTLAEATEGPSNVALYAFGDADTTVYLMGTIHVLRPGTAWKTPEYEAAFEAADAVYVEADTSDEVVAELGPFLMTQGPNPPGVTFSSYFTPEQLAALMPALEEVGIPLAALEPLRPWLASLQISMLALQKIGADPEAGVEELVEADAAAAGKPVRFLETAMAQMEMITGVPDEAWAASLTVEAGEMDDLEASFAELIGAWYDGDMGAVGRLMNEGLEAAPELSEAILFARNEDWAEQLADLVAAEPGTFLVAVGAGHLAGERSVQDYLEARGHAVRRER